jgi:MerR family transcriptional regulator, light-induced transcriptional regulator
VVMRRLTLEGVAPAEAARIARESEVEDADGAGRDPMAPPADVVEAVPVDGGRTGGGNVVALPDAAPATRGLARAAMTLDAGECRRLIDEAIRADGVAAAYERLVVPVLRALGDRWATTGAGIDVEHLLTEALLSALRSAAVPGGRTGATALLACAEDDQHSAPVHVLAAALVEAGVSVRVLGARVPREALAAAVRRSGPAAVFVYAAMPVRDPGQLLALPRMRPAPRLVLGGEGWAEVGAPEGISGDPVVVASLEEAVAHLTRIVAG